jgi:hypothetical protein
MPYILNKTNGLTLTTVQDASLDVTTNLTFVGKNYAGYGQVVDQNFLYLLENFSNKTEPSKPIQGQLWFNSSASAKKLNICYDGSNFKSIANLNVQSTTPDTSTVGDLWWDSSNGQLKAFDGSEYQIIGPVSGSSTKSAWVFADESSNDDITVTPIKYPIIKGEIGASPIVTIAKLGTTLVNNKFLIPQPGSNLITDYANGIRPGLTLAGCDENGSSDASGYYFWGTASEALKTKTSQRVNLSTTTTNANYYIPFAAATTGDQLLKTTSTFYFNPSTNVVNVIASAARYADLAERYAADAVYEVGTVLVIGGEKEVTVTTTFADTRVAGIVSKNPAYMMNSEAGTDETHPYIALKGRVPCKVQGYIKKGDLIVTSSTPGYGIAASNVFGGAIIGKALGTQSEGFGVVEVLVV